MANEQVQNPQNSAVAKKDVSKEVTEMVLARVNDMVSTVAIKMPEGYAHENAVRSAFLILSDTKDKDGKSVLETCTKASIANAILRMTIQGLNPYKHHGSFISYGGKLSFQEEYAGWKVLAKRYANVKEIFHTVVFEGDIFEYEITDGRKLITKHIQKPENINLDKIKYAYATAIFEDGSKESEVMTMEQVRASWMMGAAKGQSPAHRNFPDRMAAKTVSNRLCRNLVNATDDGEVFDHLTNEEDENTPKKPLEATTRVNIDFDDAEIVQEEKPEKQPENKPEAQAVKKEPETTKEPETRQAPKMEFE